MLFDESPAMLGQGYVDMCLSFTAGLLDRGLVRASKLQALSNMVS